MKHQSNVVCLCPLDGVIDTIGKKWGLLIINEIGNHKKLRYNQLMLELKGISPSTLASMLKDLEKEDLNNLNRHANIQNEILVSELLNTFFLE